MKSKVKSIIATAVVVVGACGIGINLNLSEVLYPKIESFFDCPLWYQISMYFSLSVVLSGLILSFLFKNKENSSRLLLHVFGYLILIGILLMGFVLAREESTFKVVIVSLGSLLFFVGIFGWLSSFIGVKKVLK